MIDTYLYEYNIFDHSKILDEIFLLNIAKIIIQYRKDENIFAELIGINMFVILERVTQSKTNINKYLSMNSYCGNQKKIKVNTYKNKMNGVKTKE